MGLITGYDYEGLAEWVCVSVKGWAQVCEFFECGLWAQKTHILARRVGLAARRTARVKRLAKEGRRIPRQLQDSDKSGAAAK